MNCAMHLSQELSFRYYPLIKVLRYVCKGSLEVITIRGSAQVNTDMKESVKAGHRSSGKSVEQSRPVINKRKA